MRAFAMFACVALAALSFGPASADTRVELLGTWPTGDQVALHRNQHFYLRLAYTSDAPTSLWVQPYFNGKPVNAGTNPSRTYPAGSGEALGWFFLFDTNARVDSVQVKAGDGSYDRTSVVATFPVSVTGDDAVAAAESPPAWLDALNAANQTAQRAADERAMHTPTTASDTAIIYGFLAAVLAAVLLGVAVPLWCLWRWRGGWRVAAAIPVALMAFVILRIIIDGARDPTSHNLWPFEILIWGAASAAGIIVLLVARKIAGVARR